MKLSLLAGGRNPGNESAEEIWNDLLDDCYENDEIAIVKDILKNSPENIAKPFYEKTIEIEETNEKISANLIWLERVFGVSYMWVSDVDICDYIQLLICSQIIVCKRIRCPCL